MLPREGKGDQFLYPSEFEDRSRRIKTLIYSLTLGGPSPAKRIFSSGQTLVKDRRQLSQLRGISRKKSITEPLDRSQRLKDVLTFSQILGMPLARKRKETEN